MIIIVMISFSNETAKYIEYLPYSLIWNRKIPNLQSLKPERVALDFIC